VVEQARHVHEEHHSRIVGERAACRTEESIYQHVKLGSPNAVSQPIAPGLWYRDVRLMESDPAMARCPRSATFAIVTLAACGGHASTPDATPDTPAAPALPGDLGPLDGFYRAMQLQGDWSLTGQGLVAPPDYLVASDVDLRYSPKPGTSREVLFVDSFSITRFLGGEWTTQLDRIPGIMQLAPYDSSEPWRSLDYARRDATGAWLYYGTPPAGDLIAARLQAYLDAGYRASDVTLVLSNVPWDAAAAGSSSQCPLPPSPGPSTGSLGVWGQCNPPADPNQWQTIVQHFAGDLAAHYGSAAADIGFEVGDEYDSTESLDGTATDYYSLYDRAELGLHAGLPGAVVVPGDFTGNGLGGPTKVYDTQQLLAHEQSRGVTPSYVPRSLNGFWNLPGVGTIPNYMPSRIVASAVASYQRLGAVASEIHQFGFLNMPAPLQALTDESSIGTNWGFQVLLGLRAQLHPRRVMHWDTTVDVPTTSEPMTVLNGTGFLALVLDHYRGAELYQLATHIVEPANTTAETAAAALWRDGTVAVIVSSFDAPPTPAAQAPSPTRVQVDLPAGLFAHGAPAQLRYVRVSMSPVDNVFARIRADLQAQVLLASSFQGCALCIAAPQQMTTDLAALRNLMTANAAAYVAILKSNLRWRSTDDGFDDNGVVHTLAVTDTSITVTLGPDEMLILEGS
jgi:hypothetical protein